MPLKNGVDRYTYCFCEMEDVDAILRLEDWTGRWTFSKPDVTLRLGVNSPSPFLSAALLCPDPRLLKLADADIGALFFSQMDASFSSHISFWRNMVDPLLKGFRKWYRADQLHDL